MLLFPKIQFFTSRDSTNWRFLVSSYSRCRTELLLKLEIIDFLSICFSYGFSDCYFAAKYSKEDAIRFRRRIDNVVLEG